jgi:hypothetical protein
MDEEMSGRYAAQEQQRIEREAQAATRGCGLLALIIAVLTALVCILVSIL